MNTIHPSLIESLLQCEEKHQPIKVSMPISQEPPSMIINPNYLVRNPICSPYPRRRIMVFDVETTGLLPKKDPITKLAPPLSEHPHILQLSFVIYSNQYRCIERTYDNYVRIDDSVEISPKIVEITGITKETCLEKGIPICDVLAEFYREYHQCDCIIAHNIDFDKAMVGIEMQRNKEYMESHGFLQYMYLFDPAYNEINKIRTFCTMRVGKKICNIVVQPAAKLDAKTGEMVVPKPYVKYPKLSELYQNLIGGEVPENMHNALVDALACLKCYHALNVARGFP